MKKIRSLLNKREALATQIVEAHKENIGKFYKSTNFLEEVVLYHITGVESLKTYLGTVVKVGNVGGIWGITQNDYIPTYIILSESEEITEADFMEYYKHVLRNLQQ